MAIGLCIDTITLEKFVLTILMFSLPVDTMKLLCTHIDIMQLLICISIHMDIFYMKDFIYKYIVLELCYVRTVLYTLFVGYNFHKSYNYI